MSAVMVVMVLMEVVVVAVVVTVVVVIVVVCFKSGNKVSKKVLERKELIETPALRNNKVIRLPGRRRTTLPRYLLLAW